MAYEVLNLDTEKSHGTFSSLSEAHDGAINRGRSQMKTIGEKLARSLFEYKGNPKSFDCTEEQLAKILDCSIEWADETAKKFAEDRARR